MFVKYYKPQAKDVFLLATLTVIFCLIVLSSGSVKAKDMINAKHLLLNISYKNEHCDFDACDMPINVEHHALIELSYCPDNTCDMFSMPVSDDQVKFYDFVLMYLYYKSEYIYLREIKDRFWMEHIDDISSKYSVGMGKPLNDNDIDCILKALADNYDISVAFSRFDENVKHTAPVVLKKCNSK